MLEKFQLYLINLSRRFGVWDLGLGLGLVLGLGLWLGLGFWLGLGLDLGLGLGLGFEVW